MRKYKEVLKYDVSLTARVHHSRCALKHSLGDYIPATCYVKIIRGNKTEIMSQMPPSAGVIQHLPPLYSDVQSCCNIIFNLKMISFFYDINKAQKVQMDPNLFCFDAFSC